MQKDIESELHSSFKRFKESQAYKEHLSEVIIHNSLSELGLMQMVSQNDISPPNESFSIRSSDDDDDGSAHNSDINLVSKNEL